MLFFLKESSLWQINSVNPSALQRSAVKKGQKSTILGNLAWQIKDDLSKQTCENRYFFTAFGGSQHEGLFSLKASSNVQNRNDLRPVLGCGLEFAE